LALGVSGCALFSQPGAPVEDRLRRPTLAAPAPRPVLPAAAQDLTHRLYAEFERWKGTPYAAGGDGPRGIDCSALVQHTLKAARGLELPRTADEQARIGSPVARGEVRAGDLVFFKTGARDRHVGIYLERGRFMHASRQRGVMISGLGDRYWRRHYWQARRIGG
jgi:cell wall-associated NlpC family hydrolase